MTLVRRRHILAVATLLLLLGLAVVLVLFAFDVRRWQSTVQRDDLRFRVNPGTAYLWRPSTVLPGDPASLALSTGDTTRWRSALQTFFYTRIGVDPLTMQDPSTLNAEAQQKLQNLMVSAKTAAERSAAANLLGVLVVTAPPVAGASGRAIEQMLQQTTEYFQRAVVLDPSNAQAKQNLELVLRVARPGKGALGKHDRSAFGFGGGHAATRVGNGY